MQKVKLSAVSSSGELTGVPIILAGVLNIFSRTGHGNMSVSRKSRKAKLLNLEDQPQILQFITDGASEASNQRKESKKRCRSTGEKLQAKKRVDSPCGLKTSNPPPLLGTNSHTDSQDCCIIGQQTNVDWNALVSNETNEDVRMYT